MELRGDPSGILPIKTVSAEYHGYSDDGKHILNGYENVTLTITPPTFWLNKLDWYSNIAQTGSCERNQNYECRGFHLSIDALINDLEANGTLITTINGVEYRTSRRTGLDRK